MAPDSKLMGKIEKLLRMSKDIGSPNEAAVAAAKVRNLLLEHNLTLSEVEAKDADVITKHIKVDQFFDKRHGKWISQLYGTLSKFNLCRSVISNYKHNTSPPVITLIGKKETIEVVEYLANQLMARAFILEKLGWRDHYGREGRGAFRRGFLRGFVVGIYVQLDEQQARDSEAITALIVVEDAAVAEKVFLS